MQIPVHIDHGKQPATYIGDPPNPEAGVGHNGEFRVCHYLNHFAHGDDHSAATNPEGHARPLVTGPALLRQPDGREPATVLDIPQD
jgi:hypothetical protein